MLIVTRKLDQALWIALHPDVPPSLTVGELFAGGPIKVMVTKIEATQVRLGISADRRLLVLRSERPVYGPPPPPGGGGPSLESDTED